MEAAIVYLCIAFIITTLALVLRSDLPRWRGLNRETLAEVIGHRSSFHNNAKSFAAIYRFTAEGGIHEVIDQVYSGTPHPPLGTIVPLGYPFGRPDLARPPRPLLWLFIYAVLVFLLAMLVAKAIGWLD
ncbi:MAG: hypothetical protein ABL914_01380 [Novosphingobium sp.]|uniref:hypothetical protein n=1 Tax=Novosphingobium sp. TaxID=1874826 RepID=UPI0032B9EADF